MTDLFLKLNFHSGLNMITFSLYGHCKVYILGIKRQILNEMFLTIWRFNVFGIASLHEVQDEWWVFVSWFLLFVHRLSSLTKLGLEHLVSCISLHVISRLNDKQRPFSLVQQTESIFFRTCRVIWIFVLKIEETIICF